MKRRSLVFLMVLMTVLLLCTVAHAIVPGNTFESAVSIGYDQTYSATHESYAVHYYKFTVASTGSVKFTFSVSNVQGGVIKVFLYQEDGTSIAQGTYRADHMTVPYDGSTRMGTSTFDAYLKKGVYRMKVVADSNYYTFNYSFTAKANPVNETYVETISQNNDTIQDASALTFGTKYVGQVGWQDNIDFYTFTATENDVFDLDFHFYFRETKIVLYNSEGTVVWSSAPTWNSFTSEGEKTDVISGLNAGKYYISIERGPYSGPTYTYSYGKYELALTKRPPHEHSYHKVVTSATMSADGKIEYVCDCGDVKSTKVISHPTSINLSATDYTYTGKAIKPRVIVKAADGTTISASSNYTVKYSSGRKNVGTYTVTIKFKGNYADCGSVTRTFNINPAKTKISKVSGSKRALTVYWKKAKGIAGYEVQISTDRYFYYNVKTVTAKSTATKTTIKGLYAKQNYYVRVRTYAKVGSGKVYSDWSEVKTGKTK